MANGEVWWADVPNDNIRPVVVLTRSRVVNRLHSVVVVPITSTARGLATEVAMGSAEDVREGDNRSNDRASGLMRTHQ
jgi:mRNA interferase MazF